MPDSADSPSATSVPPISISSPMPGIGRRRRGALAAATPTAAAAALVLLLAAVPSASPMGWLSSSGPSDRRGLGLFRGVGPGRGGIGPNFGLPGRRRRRGKDGNDAAGAAIDGILHNILGSSGSELGPPRIEARGGKPSSSSSSSSSSTTSSISRAEKEDQRQKVATTRRGDEEQRKEEEQEEEEEGKGGGARKEKGDADMIRDVIDFWFGGGGHKGMKKMWV
jgi:hypothetical protein